MEDEEPVEEAHVRFVEAIKAEGGGCFLRGWRKEIDVDGSTSVRTQAFRRASVNLGIQVAFVLQHKLHMTMEEICPEDAALLTKARSFVRTTWGSPVKMFAQLEANDRVTREGFFTGWQKQNSQWTDEELSNLFNYLDIDDVGDLGEEDMAALEERVEEPVAAKPAVKGKQEVQRMWAEAYRQDGSEHTSPLSRKAQRHWQADIFETLPELVSSKRSEYLKKVRRKALYARYNFLSHLKQHFGSEARAWRRVLDKEGLFSVSPGTLRSYLRSVDLALEFRPLWMGLDRSTDGVLSLEEVAPEQAFSLANFRRWCYTHYGSCAEVWNVAEVVFERQKAVMGGLSIQKKMPLHSLLTAVKELGWPSSRDEPGIAAQVGHALDFFHCGLICVQDLEWLDSWNPPLFLLEEPSKQAYDDLLHIMLQKYQNPLNAWRALLDVDNQNQVNWSGFLRACRTVKFQGPIGGAWRYINNEAVGPITLKDFDPQSANVLMSFKLWAEGHFGSVQHAFKALDKSDAGSLSTTEIRRALHRLDWHGDVNILLRCLGVGKGTNRRHVTITDLIFLDSWSSDQYEEAEDEEEEEKLKSQAKRASPHRQRHQVRERPAPRQAEALWPPIQHSRSSSTSTSPSRVPTVPHNGSRPAGSGKILEGRPCSSAVSLLQESGQCSPMMRRRRQLSPAEGLIRAYSSPSLSRLRDRRVHSSHSFKPGGGALASLSGAHRVH